MRGLAIRFARPAACTALLGLAGCVGAPVPVAYTPGYALPPGAPVQQVAYSATCYAGVYTCQLPGQLPLGAPCSCPGLGAPSYGNVR